ncbi:MAG: FHA domain-containing protein [Anaerolineales bacterium]|nr:FHA domain-containing protein [Anaerolineales bacterium]
MRALRLPLLAAILCSKVLGATTVAAQSTSEAAADWVLELADRPDLSAYPQVRVFTRVVDSARQPVGGLTREALILEEDGRVTSDLVVEPAALGLQVMFVIDPGAQPERVGETGQATLEEARAAIRLFANEYMRPGDTVGIWSMQGEQALVLQPPTGAASDVLTALDAFSLQPTTTVTPALEAAMDSLLALETSAVSERMLVVLSPGWRDRPDPALVQRLDASGAALSGVLTRRGLDLNSGLSALVGRVLRPGLFLHYTGPQALRSLYGAWNTERSGYRLTYTSPTGAPGSHQIGLRLHDAEAVAATTSYQAPVPDGPQIVFTSHAAGFQAGRLVAELIGVSVTTPPGSPAIDRAELFVNDESLGVREGAGPFAWAWDPAPYGEQLAADGESVGVVELRVQVTDAIGQTRSSAIRGHASFPGVDACTAYRSVPAVGRSLYAACRATGLTPPLIVLFVLLMGMLIGLIWLWRYRGAVSQAGQQVSRRLTDVYRRLTRTGGRRAPLAYLDALEGLDPAARTSFDLFGQTPIGRSHDYAELCFHAERQRSPISGLHCTVHEDEGGVGWSIEDEDSTNGTYVNGVRLPGLGQRLALHDGDVIELAQVERGGLKFRFRLAAVTAAPDIRRAPDPTRSSPAKPGRATRPLIAARGPAPEPELEFDPRRNDF